MSDLAEFTDAGFQTVIDDPSIAPADHDKVRRVLVCSGKVYFTLRDALRSAEHEGDIAVVRVEQLYPFPEAELARLLASYSRKQEVMWVQEEPRNRGGWTYMESRLRALLPDTILNYSGRDAAASPATGSMAEHIQEERELVALAMSSPPADGGVAGSELRPRGPKDGEAIEKVVQPGTAATASSSTSVAG